MQGLGFRGLGFRVLALEILNGGYGSFSVFFPDGYSISCIMVGAQEGP